MGGEICILSHYGNSREMGENLKKYIILEKAYLILKGPMNVLKYRIYRTSAKLESNPSGSVIQLLNIFKYGVGVMEIWKSPNF